VALCVELGDEISAEVNTRVRALEYLIQAKGLTGVVETVPSFRSLLVYYDPGQTAFDALCAGLGALAEQATTVQLPPSRLVELPCCYDPEFGLDLVAAAERLRLTTDELIRLHAAAEYLVYFVGFTPGLPYMAGVPERIRLPRLETPRLKVPAGSAGLGGAQYCIYSVDSPGGYWLLGRTPVRLYDPEAAEPTLLRPGDRVRMRPIDRGEYDAVAARVAARTYTPVIA
jgi:KipI family sensor histidine kinase inhibitor